MWPKKLPAFSGAPDEWPIFVSSYENSNAACGFSDVRNLIRLQESLSTLFGAGWCCPQTTENDGKITKSLREMRNSDSFVDFEGEGNRSTKIGTV